MEFGVKLLYHIYTRPVWVECYPEFCTHGMIVQDHFGYRAHGWNSIVDLYDVSVGDLRRRFVSSDLAVRCVHVSFVVLHVLHVHVQVVAYVPDDH